MARKPAIPEAIKQQVSEIVNNFNQRNSTTYKPSYKGRFLYLGRTKRPNPLIAGLLTRFLYSNKAGDSEQVSPICRLEYKGAIDNWEFAIYRYSKNGYDPDEWFFPGSEDVNGTVEGAMKAGLKAYSE
jgi:hypothetical protein